MIYYRKNSDSQLEKRYGSGMTRQSPGGKLRAFVESMIASGQYAPGDRLPPIRALSEQFELTPGTARRMLKELCDKGVLTFRHGSGTYVCDRPEQTGSRRQTIAVVLWNEQKISSYCAHAASGMIAAAENTGYEFRFYYVPYYDYTRSLDLPDEIWNCSAVIFLGVYDSLQLNNFKATRPCVGLEMHRTLGNVLSPVSIDPYGAAELAVDFFRSRNIRDVTVSTMHTPLHHVRANVFIEQWREFGTFRTVTNRAELPTEFPAEGHGIFFASGTDHNYHLLGLKQKFGCIDNRDANMLSVDGKSLLLSHYEPANTIYIDWQLAGEVVFSECRRRLENPGSDVRRIYLAPHLHLKNPPVKS